MPKLWSETIEAHRRAVFDASLDAAAALVSKRGLLSVKMSQIAEETGIGRATLYKYFPDVEAILLAWHERQIAAHLEHLKTIQNKVGSAVERLEVVLEAYALISYNHHRTDLAASLHRGEYVIQAQRRLLTLIESLLKDALKAGQLRDDVAPAELATYSLHALSAANSLHSKAAVQRLVAVTLAGLRKN